MKVYIASLSDYNAGTLLGEWFDLTDYSDGDSVLKAIGEMLERFDEEHGTEENAGVEREEWAAHDWEDMPDSLTSEHPDWDNVMAYVNTASEMDEDELEAFTDWAENFGHDLGGAADLYDDFRDAYNGKHDSEEDFAEQLLEETGDLQSIPKHLQYYFDYKAFARDLFMGDYWMSSNGHVFRNN